MKTLTIIHGEDYSGKSFLTESICTQMDLTQAVTVHGEEVDSLQDLEAAINRFYHSSHTHAVIGCRGFSVDRLPVYASRMRTFVIRTSIHGFGHIHSIPP